MLPLLSVYCVHVYCQCLAILYHNVCVGLPLDFGGYGVCQAGTSAVFAVSMIAEFNKIMNLLTQEETSGGNFALGVGAPGTNFWRGNRY